MSEGLPLSNQELHDYLSAQQTGHTTPTSPHYVGPDKAHLHVASYDLLRDHVQGAVDPLVRVEDAGHRLAAESLHEDVGLFSSMLGEDMRNLRTGLRQPEKAREVIRQSYAEGGGTPPKAYDPSHLSFKEVAEYIDILAERLPQNEEKALHSTSLKLLTELVSRWQQSQRRAGQPNISDSASVPLNKPLPGSPEGAQSIDIFLTEQRNHFESITKKAITDLGQAALNASGVRQITAAHTARHGSSWVSPASPAPARRGGMTAEDIEAAKRVIDGLNVNSDMSAPAHAERQEVPAIIGEAVEAARGTAIIHTDVPKRVVLAYTYHEASLHSPGFTTFGDGTDGGRHALTTIPNYMKETVGGYNPVKGPDGQNVTNMVEAVAFSQTTDSTDMYVDYAYNPYLGNHPRNYPVYPEASGGRNGSMLIVRIRLPQVVGEKLQQAIMRDPKIVRELTHQVVVQRGASEQGRAALEQAWQRGGLGDKNDSNPMRPPYDKLPPNHRIYLIQPRQTADAYDTARPL